MKLLLTSVFGPYGVDDAYGRKENLMEILHNQVTREQGVFSMRFNQETYGLYLIAENLKIPTAILDFPSRRRFIAEIKKGYDYVGIQFIIPNIDKTIHMAQLIRRYSPKTKIILGGHGTSLEDIEHKVPCDVVCRGEGIRFLRHLFGEDVSAPIKHPIRYSSFNRYILGMPVSNRMIPEGIIMPGMGCVNGCRFCATSHLFQRQYIPFLNTGKEFFDLCHTYEKEMGITDFFVLDENFFKSDERSRDLLALMETYRKPYSFNIFSSAETVMKMGIDFIQRIGIDFLWMGVESQTEIYEKNRGIDFYRLIQDLRHQGVSVLTSGILFLDHHTPETIWDDIDFLIHLKADFIQFMGLGITPGTPLENEYRKANRVLDEIPYMERHGQAGIWFKHPHFTPRESGAFLTQAFKKDFKENGPSILRMAETYLLGAIATENPQDEFMTLRHEQRKKNASLFYPILDALITHAPDENARQYAHDVRERYNRYFGKRSAKTRLYSLALQVSLVKEKLRTKWVENNMRQPQTRFTTYRMHDRTIEKGKAEVN
ncbi:MAG: B12-binding domain-containing radical SAM protein [Candidatus Omnitrophota bacterium]